MSTALGRNLILDMDGSNPRSMHFPNRPLDRALGSPSSIDIHKQWELADVGDPAGILEDILKVCDTKIG
jgi:hypothetical protein